MKRMWVAGIACLFILAIAGITSGADSPQEMQQGMDQGTSMEMDSSGHTAGTTIHTSVVEGYRLIYQLYDMKAAGQAENVTNHLMVNITDQSGAPVENAQVGYFVTGPDGKDQKLMCMGMGGGYGANLDLGLSGEYVIKTKAVAGDTKLIDSFTYTVKKP